MGAVLALGATHFPPLALPDQHMADVFKWALRDPRLAEERRDPAAWTELLRGEWGDDEGLSAARAHREAMRVQFERIRLELEAFQPDVVMVWGDDQYELFNEECVPPFAICAFEDLSTQLWQRPFYKGRPNAWDEDPESTYLIKGHREAGKHLATALLERGIDMAYSYQPAAGRPMPAAFANTLRYIDWSGVGFPYPSVFFSVNCYGRRLVANKGGWPT
jgi:hypothetical protein